MGNAAATSNRCQRASFSIDSREELRPLAGAPRLVGPRSVDARAGACYSRQPMEAAPLGRLAVVIADAPAADLADYAALVQAAELRVAADGGARYFLQAGLLPHVAIGDFDSL